MLNQGGDFAEIFRLPTYFAEIYLSFPDLLAMIWGGDFAEIWFWQEWFIWWACQRYPISSACICQAHPSWYLDGSSVLNVFVVMPEIRFDTLSKSLEI